MEKTIYPLHFTKIGQRVTIARLLARDGMRQRLMDLGFVEGTTVRCVLREPRGESAAYLVRGTTIALRREDAQNILVS